MPPWPQGGNRSRLLKAYPARNPNVLAEPVPPLALLAPMPVPVLWHRIANLGDLLDSACVENGQEVISLMALGYHPKTICRFPGENPAIGSRAAPCSTVPALKFINVLGLQSLGRVIVKCDLPAISPKQVADDIVMILHLQQLLAQELDPLNANGFFPPCVLDHLLGRLPDLGLRRAQCDQGKHYCHRANGCFV